MNERMNETSFRFFPFFLPNPPLRDEILSAKEEGEKKLKNKIIIIIIYTITILDEIVFAITIFIITLS